MQLLRCFLTKKYTLEVMEEFVDSEVLKAVRQRIAEGWHEEADGRAQSEA
jgi:hypothetical protein